MHKWMDHGQNTPPPEGQQRRTYIAVSITLPHQTDLAR